MDKKTKGPETTPVDETALTKRGIVDVVEKRIADLVGDAKLHLPEHYSAENALMAAWLKLQATVFAPAVRPPLTVKTLFPTNDAAKRIQIAADSH